MRAHTIISARLHKVPANVPSVATTKPPTRLGPKKIPVASLPVTGSDVFGREEDIAFLDAAWTNKDINVVTFALLYTTALDRC
jgi:hypothetical protein